jgi:CO/xanthine dehydrogenase Mo-binding subunit
MTTPPWKWSGRHFPPIEDKRFVLGKGRYINDVVLPRMLHLAPVPSPHGHALIKSIDTAKAAQLPGVVTIMVGADLPAVMESIPQMYASPGASPGCQRRWRRGLYDSPGSDYQCLRRCPGGGLWGAPDDYSHDVNPVV